MKRTTFTRQCHKSVLAVALGLAFMLGPAQVGRGQTVANAQVIPAVDSTVAQEISEGQVRDGFTIKAGIGSGNQGNRREEVGLSAYAGPNVGIGRFLSERLAFMLRLSVSTSRHDRWVTGVVAPSAQYWLSNKFNVEVGAGYGFYASEIESAIGIGLLGATGLSVFQQGRTSVQVGFEGTAVLNNADSKYEKFTLNYWTLALTVTIQHL